MGKKGLLQGNIKDMMNVYINRQTKDIKDINLDLKMINYKYSEYKKEENLFFPKKTLKV
jgi:hypothetical protein